MVDIKKSVRIYNHLMNGRILNRQILASHGAFENDPLFSELMDNLEDYRRQYQMGGFSLIANADYAYLIKGDSYEIGKTEIAMKAYCLLLLLGKYLTTHNYTLSKLTSEKGGLTQADFHKIEAMPHTQEILERAGMGDDLYRNIKSILIERGVMFEKPSEQKFVLSNAGKAFFDELMMSFEDMETDDGADVLEIDELDTALADNPHYDHEAAITSAATVETESGIDEESNYDVDVDVDD